MNQSHRIAIPFPSNLPLPIPPCPVFYAFHQSRIKTEAFSYICYCKNPFLINTPIADCHMLVHIESNMICIFSLPILFLLFLNRILKDSGIWYHLFHRLRYNSHCFSFLNHNSYQAIPKLY